MEPTTGREINLFDVADWLWSYRILAALLALVGLAGAAAVWFLTPPAAPTYRASFGVYSSGTPVRSATEITDILLGQLSDSLPALVVGKASNPLVVDLTSTSDLEVVQHAAQALNDSLVAEVQELQADTASLVGRSEAALTMNLDAKSFVEGSESGLIKIVRVSVRELVAPRPVRTAILMALGSAFLFLFLAGSHSFWRRWRQRGARNAAAAHCVEGEDKVGI